MLKSSLNRILGRAPAPKADGKPGRAEGAKRTLRETVIEYAKAIGSAVLIALVLRQFLFQAFRIPTGSMLETLQIGDFLFEVFGVGDHAQQRQIHTPGDIGRILD